MFLYNNITCLWRVKMYVNTFPSVIISERIKFMYKIFNFMTLQNLYERCIFASVSHAIMNGKYPNLAVEHSWDGRNYSFQNLEGIRGTISFGDNIFVCMIQSEDNFITGEDKLLFNFLKGLMKKLVALP